MPTADTEDIYMVPLVLTTLIVLNTAAAYIPAPTVLQIMELVSVIIAT